MSEQSNIKRIIAVLSAVSGDQGGLTAARLIACTGMSRSTGFGLLAALEQREYLKKKADGCYVLGAAARVVSFCQTEAELPLPGFKAIQKSEDPALGNLDLSPDLFETFVPSGAAGGGPWRLGFANASSSNPWRRALMNSVGYSVKLHEEKISGFRTEDAQDDSELQAAQIEDLAGSGIDALILSATPDPEGQLTSALTGVLEQDIPVVAVDRRPERHRCYSAFVTASDELIGRFSAIWLAERLSGKGRIWLLPGLAKASPASRRLAAAKAAFAYFPDISLEGERFTGWTHEGGFDAVRDLLERHGAPPDGVWCDSGLQATGAIQAFRINGGVLPPHTGGDINGMFRLCLELKLPFCAFDYPAAMGARAVDLAVSLLEGNAVPRRVEVPVPAILPRGAETRSIKADILAENYVRWDLPDEAILSQGLSPATRRDG